MSDIDYSLEYQFDSDSFDLVFDKSVIVGSIYFDCHSFHSVTLTSLYYASIPYSIDFGFSDRHIYRTVVDGSDR